MGGKAVGDGSGAKELILILKRVRMNQLKVQIFGRPPRYLGSETSVGVVDSSRNAVLARDGFNLLNQADNRLVLLVRLAQRRFELFVSVQETLDLFHRVHDEHVDQIFASAVQPIVEWLQQQQQQY